MESSVPDRSLRYCSISSWPVPAPGGSKPTPAKASGTTRWSVRFRPELAHRHPPQVLGVVRHDRRQRVEDIVERALRYLGNQLVRQERALGEVLKRVVVAVPVRVDGHDLVRGEELPDDAARDDPDRAAAEDENFVPDPRRVREHRPERTSRRFDERRLEIVELVGDLDRGGPSVIEEVPQGPVFGESVVIGLAQ
jgi:hypothetical protein